MIDSQTGLLIQGFAAFTGAFCAFLFLRLNEFLTKLYQREVKHYNSLVNLETQLNEIGGIIHDNLYILPNFIKIIRSGNVYFNNLHSIPVDKSHYQNLYDLNLLNDLFSYNYQARKLNDDIKTVTAGYQEIKKAFIQKNINKNDYLVNSQILAKNLKLIEIFLINLQKKTIKMLARARIKIRHDKPLGTKLQSLFILSSKIEKQELKNEIIKLNKEIEETKTTSQKEIEEVLRKKNRPVSLQAL